MIAAWRTEPKRAVRRLATGVTVVTTGRGEQVHGSTVSCVAAVAQEPPLVSVGLRRGSYFTRVAMRNGSFAVNVLSDRQAGLADWFAHPGRPRGARQFDPVRTRTDPETGLTLLRDCVAVLVCTPRHVYPAAEYDLLIAEVVSAQEQQGTPLVSYGGGLHRAELQELPRERGWRHPVGAAAISVD